MKSFIEFLVKMLMLAVAVEVLICTGWGVIPVILVMYVGYRLFTLMAKKRDRYKKDYNDFMEWRKNRD